MGRKKSEINPLSGLRIKEFCNAAGITQKELAEKAGVSEKTISDVVCGRIPMTQGTAALIANAFPGEHLQPSWFLGTSDLPTTGIQNVFDSECIDMVSWYFQNFMESLGVRIYKLALLDPQLFSDPDYAPCDDSKIVVYDFENKKVVKMEGALRDEMISGIRDKVVSYTKFLLIDAIKKGTPVDEYPYIADVRIEKAKFFEKHTDSYSTFGLKG